MNLLQIRQWFVRESGRYDLVVDDSGWVDNGANQYISSGQRMLDRMQNSPKSLGRFFQMVIAGATSVTFQDCRAIKEVWMVQSGTGRRRLEKRNMLWLRENYADMGSVENGSPLYYSPAILRAAPELHLQPISGLSTYNAFMDVMYTSNYAYNGIMFLPPADGTYMVEIWGYFYSAQMTLDTHESFWSVTHPELLVMAAQCVTEKFHRNTEGVNDWLAAIRLELQGIDFDMVEEDISDVSQMNG